MTLPEFQNPEAFLLLISLPLLMVRTLWLGRRRKVTVQFPGTRLAARSGSSLALRLRHILLVLRCLAIIALITALARPRLGEEIEEISTEGVDIMLVLDVSESMIALDMLDDRALARIARKDAGDFYKSGKMEKHSRLGAAREVIGDFISRRKHDRLGLVVFGARAYTQCPLTLDYGILGEFLQEVKIGIVDGSRTAIGSAVMTAVNRLKDSEAKSKVIVLLTDGANNGGQVNPLTAAKVAKKKGIKLYTVGVGKQKGTRLELAQNPFTGQLSWTERQIQSGEGIDAPTLKKMAEITGGQFHLASDRQKLESIYATIDQLERTEIHSSSYTRYKELFHWLLIAALAFLLFEILLANTRFLKIP